MRAPRRQRWRAQHLEGIDLDVWDFRIGGFLLLRKRPQDRKGRELAYDDQRHYVFIADLQETIHLMEDIDQMALPFSQ